MKAPHFGNGGRRSRRRGDPPPSVEIDAEIIRWITGQPPVAPALCGRRYVWRLVHTKKRDRR